MNDQKTLSLIAYFGILLVLALVSISALEKALAAHSTHDIHLTTHLSIQ